MKMLKKRMLIMAILVISTGLSCKKEKSENSHFNLPELLRPSTAFFWSVECRIGLKS